MKIISFEDFCKHVDKKVPPKLKNDTESFWNSNPKWKKFIFSWWKYFVVVGIAIILFALALGITYAISQTMEVALIVAAVVTCIITFVLTLAFIFQVTSYRKKLRELINETQLILDTFESDPNIFQATIGEPTITDRCESTIVDDNPARRLYNDEKARFGIADKAYVSSQTENFSFNYHFKHEDYFTTRIETYTWQEIRDKQTVTYNVTVGIFEYIINDSNADMNNAVDYELFQGKKLIGKAKDFIDLESKEFNKIFSLTARDEIKSRVLFTPSVQNQMVQDYKKALIKDFSFEKNDNRIRIIYRPLAGQLAIIGNRISDLDTYIKETMKDLIKDVYSLIEFLQFIQYNTNVKKFSY